MSRIYPDSIELVFFGPYNELRSPLDTLHLIQDIAEVRQGVGYDGPPIHYVSSLKPQNIRTNSFVGKLEGAELRIIVIVVNRLGAVGVKANSPNFWPNELYQHQWFRLARVVSAQTKEHSGGNYWVRRVIVFRRVSNSR